MAAGLDRKAQLRADAVGARHQHRPAIAIQRNLEQRAEPAEAAEHFGAHRALDGGLDAFDEFIAGFDIDAGIFVGDRLGGGHTASGEGGLCYFTRRCGCTTEFLVAYGVVPFAERSGWRCCRHGSIAVAAHAVTVPDLYETAQPVDGSRDAAFVEALKTVLVRVSGQRDAAAARRRELSEPRKYVQRFGFTADNVLEVGFDSVIGRSAAVEGRLADLGARASGDAGDARRRGGGGSCPLGRPPTTPAREREAIDERRASARTAAEVARDGSRRSAPRPERCRRFAAACCRPRRATARTPCSSVVPAAVSVHWTLVSSDGAAQASGGLEDGVHLAADTFARVFAASDRRSAASRRGRGHHRSQRLRGDAELPGRHDAGARRRARAGRGRHDALQAGSARRRSDVAACDRARSPAGAARIVGRRSRARTSGSRSAISPERPMRHIPNALVHTAHAAGRAGRLAAGRRRVSADARGCSRSRPRPTASMASSRSAAAGPRSSARFSIRSPTRSCWSACSSRSPRSVLVPVWLAVTAVARDVIITAGAITYNALYGYPHGRPTAISKLNTLCQIIYLLLVVAAHAVDSTRSRASRARRAGVRHDGRQRPRLRHHLLAQGDRASAGSAAVCLDEFANSCRSGSGCATRRCSQLLPGSQPTGRRCAALRWRRGARPRRCRLASGCTVRARVGKTHLLQALCARAGQDKQRAAYVAAARGRCTRARKCCRATANSRSCASTMPRRSPGDAGWERALFRLHQELDERGGRLVVVRRRRRLPPCLRIGRPGLAAERRARADAAAAR